MKISKYFPKWPLVKNSSAITLFTLFACFTAFCNLCLFCTLKVPNHAIREQESTGLINRLIKQCHNFPVNTEDVQSWAGL